MAPPGACFVAAKPAARAKKEPEKKKSLQKEPFEIKKEDKILNDKKK
jgi:hypothetical protein